MNTQVLMDMISLAEEHGVIMQQWFVNDERCTQPEHICGSVGCLVGTYLVHNPRVLPFIEGAVEDHCDDIIELLDISERYFDWLFCWYQTRSGSHLISAQTSISEVSTEMAVKRLRRFIYFKIKQREIYEAWNERQHTRHAQSENTNHVAELQETS